MSLRYNIPVKVLEAIVDSQFSFIKEIIEKGEFESVRLPYYGRFLAPPKRVKWINEQKEKNKLKKDECDDENKV